MKNDEWKEWKKKTLIEATGNNGPQRYVALRRKGSLNAEIVGAGLGLGWAIHVINEHSDQYDDIYPEEAPTVKDFLAKIPMEINGHTCTFCPSGEYR
jgi:hypothetical protein